MVERYSEKVIPFILGSLAFWVYAFTAYPTVAGGDSGELIAAACSLGVAHPPGYPLYTLLGKSFATVLPAAWGSIAYRITLLSAISTAVAVGLVAKSVTLWTRDRWAGWVAGGLFAFSPLVWRYAGQAEVFGLHNLFIAQLILFCVLFAQNPSARLLVWTSFWCGLGLAHHHLLVVYAAPALLWMAYGLRKSTAPVKVYLGAFCALSLGLLPYLYLPWASSHIPLVNWGDQTTWSGFLNHFFRTEYGTFRLAPQALATQGDFLGGVFRYLGDLNFEFIYLGVPIGIAGVVLSLGLGRLSWVFCGMVGFFIVVFFPLSKLNLSDPLGAAVQARFYQQLNILMACWIGVAYAGFGTWLRKRYPILVPMIALLIVGLQGALHFKDSNQSRNQHFRDYGLAVLEALPQDGVLWVGGDHIGGALMYLQACEGMRPDARIISTAYLDYEWSRRWITKNFPLLQIPGHGTYSQRGYSVADFLLANPSTRIFSLLGVPAWDKSLSNQVPPRVPQIQGPLEELTSHSTSWQERAAIATRAFDHINLVGLAGFAPGTWEHVIQVEVLNFRHNFGVQMLNEALADPSSGRERFEAIATQFEAVRPFLGAINPRVYKNLGTTYMYLSKFEPAVIAKIVENWSQFLASAEAERDPETPAVRQLLLAAQGALVKKP